MKDGKEMKIEIMNRKTDWQWVRVEFKCCCPLWISKSHFLFPEITSKIRPEPSQACPKAARPSLLLSFAAAMWPSPDSTLNSERETWTDEVCCNNWDRTRDETTKEGGDPMLGMTGMTWLQDYYTCVLWQWWAVHFRYLQPKRCSEVLLPRSSGVWQSNNGLPILKWKRYSTSLFVLEHSEHSHQAGWDNSILLYFTFRSEYKPEAWRQSSRCKIKTNSGWFKE